MIATTESPPDSLEFHAAIMADNASGAWGGEVVTAYCSDPMPLPRRFENPALHHRLIQIAMDGSQKIPQRSLATLAANQRGGHDCPALLTATGAWLRHVRGEARPVEDPRAADLSAAWATHGPDGMCWAKAG